MEINKFSSTSTNILYYQSLTRVVSVLVLDVMSMLDMAVVWVRVSMVAMVCVVVRVVDHMVRPMPVANCVGSIFHPTDDFVFASQKAGLAD